MRDFHTVEKTPSIFYIVKKYCLLTERHSFPNTKDSLRKRTQVSKALLLSNINDPEPNEERDILRDQGFKIKRTEISYPDSGRKIVETYD